MRVPFERIGEEADVADWVKEAMDHQNRNVEKIEEEQYGKTVGRKGPAGEIFLKIKLLSQTGFGSEPE